MCFRVFRTKLDIFARTRSRIYSIHPTKSWLDQVVVEEKKKKKKGRKKLQQRSRMKKRENIAITSKSINYPMEGKKIWHVKKCEAREKTRMKKCWDSESSIFIGLTQQNLYCFFELFLTRSKNVFVGVKKHHNICFCPKLKQKE